MSDSGFDNADQRRAAIEHAASLTALDQRADQAQTAYRNIVASEPVPPERKFGHFRYLGTTTNITLDGILPEGIEDLNKRLEKYRLEFEDGSVHRLVEGKIRRGVETGKLILFHEQVQTITLQLLLKNGSVNFDLLEKALSQIGMYDPEDTHYSNQAYDAFGNIHMYAKEARPEEIAHKDLTQNKIPNIFDAAVRLAEAIPDEKLKPFEYLSDDGKPMRARLMKQPGHEDRFTDGVVAELTEIHQGVEVGTKEYIYLGELRSENGGRYKAKKLGNVLNILKDPLGNISARDEDYPDAKTYRLTAESDDERAMKQNVEFLQTVGIFGSLVEANKENLGENR